MVKVPVIFIIGHDKNGLLPHLGILGEDVHDLRNIPTAIPGRGRMIREVRRSHDPRHGGESAAVYILTELMQDVPLGNLHLPLFPSGFIVQGFQLMIVSIADIGYKRLLIEILRLFAESLKIFRTPLFEIFLCGTQHFFFFCNILFGLFLRRLRFVEGLFGLRRFPGFRQRSSEDLFQRFDFAGDLYDLLLQSCEISCRKPHIVLGKILQGIAAEIGEPLPFSLAKPTTRGEIVLVDFPGDIILFQ